MMVEEEEELYLGLLNVPVKLKLHLIQLYLSIMRVIYQCREVNWF